MHVSFSLLLYMVLSGPKKTSMLASTANQTSIFGIMGGLAPSTAPQGRKRFMFKRARNRQTIPLAPVPRVGVYETEGLTVSQPRR